MGLVVASNIVAACPSSSDIKTAIQNIVQEKKDVNFNITTTSGFLMNKKTITQKGKLALSKTLPSDFKVESLSESTKGCKYEVIEKGQKVGAVSIYK